MKRGDSVQRTRACRSFRPGTASGHACHMKHPIKGDLTPNRARPLHIFVQQCTTSCSSCTDSCKSAHICAAPCRRIYPPRRLAGVLRSSPLRPRASIVPSPSRQCREHHGHPARACSTPPRGRGLGEANSARGMPVPAMVPLRGIDVRSMYAARRHGQSAPRRTTGILPVLQAPPLPAGARHHIRHPSIPTRLLFRPAGFATRNCRGCSIAQRCAPVETVTRGPPRRGGGNERPRAECDTSAPPHMHKHRRLRTALRHNRRGYRQGAAGVYCNT